MKRIQKTALAITRWVGSPTSVVVHTILFIASFLSVRFGFINFEEMLLVLTTIVSLEAIYLAIFIQMTVNRNTESLEEVEEDIDEIQVDIDEIQEDVDELQEDVGEIQEDVDEIQEDVQQIDVPETKKSSEVTLAMVYTELRKLSTDVEELKARRAAARAKIKADTQ